MTLNSFDSSFKLLQLYVYLSEPYTSFKSLLFLTKYSKKLTEDFIVNFYWFNNGLMWFDRRAKYEVVCIEGSQIM